MSSDFGGSRISIESTTRNLTTNGGFNLVRTMLGGSVIHDTEDDVAPIRTQLGTVGGNHGFSMVASFENPDGKTEADLGSVWTDGRREYVLLAIDKGGELIIGGDYVVSSRGVTSRLVSPRGPLVHVSGGIHLGQVAASGVRTQLYPSTSRVRVTASCDGATVQRDARCLAVTVREAYEVLDYADLYERAKSHIGQSYVNLAVDGMVRVENVYRFTADGRTLIGANVTALETLTLGETGLLQSTALTSGADETVIRQLPGVRPIDGHDFRQGVDLSKYSKNERIASGDLIERKNPPTFSLDRIVSKRETRVGFAIGYVPSGTHAGSQTARSEAAKTNYWDIRSTRKSYPVAFTGRLLREGNQVKVEGFRTYLAPGQADRVSTAAATNQPADFTQLWS